MLMKRKVTRILILLHETVFLLFRHIAKCKQLLIRMLLSWNVMTGVELPSFRTTALPISALFYPKNPTKRCCQAV